MNKIQNLSKNEEFLALKEQIKQAEEALYKEKQLAAKQKEYINKIIPYCVRLAEQARRLEHANAKLHCAKEK